MPRGGGSLHKSRNVTPSKPKKTTPAKRSSPTTQRRRRSDREIRTLEKLSNAINFKSHVEPSTAYSTRTGRATTSPFSLDALQERQAQTRIAKEQRGKTKRVRTRPKPKKTNRVRPVPLKKPTKGSGTPGRKRGSQQKRSAYTSHKEDIVIEYGYVPLITPRPPPPTSPYGTRLADLAERNKPENKPIVNTPAWRPIEDDSEPKRVSARARGDSAAPSTSQTTHTPSLKLVEKATKKTPKKSEDAKNPKKPIASEKTTAKMSSAAKNKSTKKPTSKSATPSKSKKSLKAATTKPVRTATSSKRRR